MVKRLKPCKQYFEKFFFANLVFFFKTYISVLQEVCQYLVSCGIRRDEGCYNVDLACGFEVKG